MSIFQKLPILLRHANSTFRTINFKRLTNILKLNISFLFSRMGILSTIDYRPSFISIEPADFCNLKCPECPVGMRTNNDRPKELMSVELYKKVIEELKPTLTHIIFYFQGEPLLSPVLPKMIQYAHDQRIYTSTSTNAQLLNEKNAKLLVESELDKLIVSIDGTTQDTYETYRIGGKLQKAIAGVEQVVKWKKTLGKVTPFVEIQCLVLRSNEQQMGEMKQLAKRLEADRLVFKTAQFYDFEDGNPLMPTNEKHSRYKKNTAGKYELKRKMRNRCYRLWSGSVVTTKGDVLPCCFDKDSTYLFGNVYKSTFSDCWKSKKAQSFRKQVLNNRAVFEMCKNCTS